MKKSIDQKEGIHEKYEKYVIFDMHVNFMSVF